MSRSKTKSNLTLIEIIGRNGLSQNCLIVVSFFVAFFFVSSFFVAFFFVASFFVASFSLNIFFSSNIHKLLSKIEVQLCLSRNHIAKDDLEGVFKKSIKTILASYRIQIWSKSSINGFFSDNNSSWWQSNSSAGADPEDNGDDYEDHGDADEDDNDEDDNDEGDSKCPW